MADKEPESKEAFALRMLRSMAQDGRIFKVSYPSVVEEGKAPPEPRPDDYFVKMAARDGLDRLDVPSASHVREDGRVAQKVERSSLVTAVGGEEPLQQLLADMKPEKTTTMRTGGALWKATHRVGR